MTLSGMTLSLVLCAAMPTPPSGPEGRSRVERMGSPSAVAGGSSALALEIVDDATGRPLAARVVVRGADGSYADGGGRGLYADGRFFADGRFDVALVPGNASVSVSCGPEYEPLAFDEEITEGRRLRLRARMRRWFDAAARGWYCGDSHVHTQHDPTGAIRTDGAFTVLQARAQGLRYVSQATKASREEDAASLTAPGLIFANAEELGGGAYVGHFTSPGIASPLTGLGPILREPLPAPRMAETAHRLGGILTYTHPLAPPHQLHWMGATGAMSDGVLGKCADAMDIDSPACQALWFALLNLGNRIAASGSTDSTLERRHTLTPGDRRVYSHARSFTLPAIVGAIREGRTFATNGAPLFLFLRMGDREPGDTLPADGSDRQVRLEVHSLRAIREVTLYRRGAPVKRWGPSAKAGALELTWTVRESEACWYAARAEDAEGGWALTSPVYFSATHPGAGGLRGALLLEIANCTRMVELRRGFFAHMIATVPPDDPLASVELLKDGVVCSTYRTADGGGRPAALPVAGGTGDYVPAYAWHPSAADACHFLADAPIRDTGWYSLRAVTRSGRTLRTDAVRFDAEHRLSSEVCTAHIWGPGTSFTRHGYGEEMPLAEVSPPYDGDHWWYPLNGYWRVSAAFDGSAAEWSGGDAQREALSFRREASQPI